MPPCPVRPLNLLPGLCFLMAGAVQADPTLATLVNATEATWLVHPDDSIGTRTPAILTLCLPGREAAAQRLDFTAALPALRLVPGAKLHLCHDQPSGQPVNLWLDLDQEPEPGENADPSPVEGYLHYRTDLPLLGFGADQTSLLGDFYPRSQPNPFRMVQGPDRTLRLEPEPPPGLWLPGCVIQ